MSEQPKDPGEESRASKRSRRPRRPPEEIVRVFLDENGAAAIPAREAAWQAFQMGVDAAAEGYYDDREDRQAKNETDN